MVQQRNHHHHQSPYIQFLKLLQAVHLRPSEIGEDILLRRVDQHRQSSEPITATKMRWPAGPHSWRAKRLPVREGQDWQGRPRIYPHFSSASIGAPYRDGQLTEYPAIRNKVFHREAIKAENTLCTIPNNHSAQVLIQFLVYVWELFVPFCVVFCGVW